MLTPVDLESIFGVTQIASPLGEGRFFEDINYGDQERQQLCLISQTWGINLI